MKKGGVTYCLWWWFVACRGPRQVGPDCRTGGGSGGAARWWRLREGVCVCVCACEREREREREKPKEKLPSNNILIRPCLFCMPTRVNLRSYMYMYFYEMCKSSDYNFLESFRDCVLNIQWCLCSILHVIHFTVQSSNAYVYKIPDNLKDYPVVMYMHTYFNPIIRRHIKLQCSDEHLFHISI